MISNPHIPPSPTVDDGDEGEKGGEEEKEEDCYLLDCHAARPRTRRNNVRCSTPITIPVISHNSLN